MYLKPYGPYANRRSESIGREDRLMTSISEFNEFICHKYTGAAISSICRIQLQGRFFL